MRIWFTLLAATTVALLGCSSSPVGDSAEDDDDEGEVGPGSNEPEPNPSGVSVDALGDGTAGSVEFVTLYEAPQGLGATDLAFNLAKPDELWVTLRLPPSGKVCTSKDNSGCGALVGRVVVVEGAGSSEPAATLEEDGNAWHFMRRPSAIAWGENELFGTCGEARTGNYEDDAAPYTGPVLWSSDPSIFGAVPTASQNGTHLDMLHETPFCMGMAHEQGNAYWVFNGDAGSLDRYDFHQPHRVGGEDHADGEVHRYVAGELRRKAEVPSHLAYDTATGFVYVADTGNGRVLRVDPSTAEPGAAIMTYEVLAASGRMDGATVRELARGTFEEPSGLALEGNLLFVGDAQTGVIHALDLDGNELRSLDTKLGANALGGLVVGPDAKLYFTDRRGGGIYRIDPE